MPTRATKDVEPEKKAKKTTKELSKKVAKKPAAVKKSVKTSSNIKTKKVEIKKPVKKISVKDKEKKSKTKKENKTTTKIAVKKVASKTLAKKDTVLKKDSIKKVKTPVKKDPVKKIKTSIKKEPIKKTTIKKSKKTADIINEYYELPYVYNQTIVKILAQTPNSLFIYWDVSSSDIKNLIKTYGEDFYNKTRPVLIIKNETKGYTYEAPINDFANSWYLHIGDTMCKYHVELGRRFYEPLPDKNDYVYIASSNVIESPNDHILLEKEQHMLYYYNLKTKQITSTKFLSFITNMGKIYGTYKDMKAENIHNNPSSGGLSSSGNLFPFGGFYE